MQKLRVCSDVCSEHLYARNGGGGGGPLPSHREKTDRMWAQKDADVTWMNISFGAETFSFCMGLSCILRPNEMSRPLQIKFD
jgi:hypothetical protein